MRMAPLNKLSGAVMSTCAVVSQPALSLRSTVYTPSQSPVASGVPCPAPGGGDQKKVYGGTPPFTPTAAVPSQAPAQVSGELLMSKVVGCGEVTVAVSMLMQPEKLITCTR